MLALSLFFGSAWLTRRPLKTRRGEARQAPHTVLSSALRNKTLTNQRLTTTYASRQNPEGGPLAKPTSPSSSSFAVRIQVPLGLSQSVVFEGKVCLNPSWRREAPETSGSSHAPRGKADGRCLLRRAKNVRTQDCLRLS